MAEAGLVSVGLGLFMFGMPAGCVKGCGIQHDKLVLSQTDGPQRRVSCRLLFQSTPKQATMWPIDLEWLVLSRGALASPTPGPGSPR